MVWILLSCMVQREEVGFEGGRRLEQPLGDETGSQPEDEYGYFMGISKPIVFILLWWETQGGHGTLFCNLSAWKQ